MINLVCGGNVSNCYITSTFSAYPTTAMWYKGSDFSSGLDEDDDYVGGARGPAGDGEEGDNDSDDDMMGEEDEGEEADDEEEEGGQGFAAPPVAAWSITLTSVSVIWQEDIFSQYIPHDAPSCI